MQTPDIIKKTRRLLAAEMYASILVTLATVVLYETETLLPGDLSGDKNTEFITVSVMELLTICLVPLALRLFKLKRINAELTSTQGRALAKWGSARMAMLCVPMIANTLLYYLSGLNVAFGYMAIICLVCLTFVYPGTARCLAETGMEQ